MTALDGWVHDRFGTGWMLQTDALSAILFVVVALFVLQRSMPRGLQGLAEDNNRIG
jgi:fucose permease